MKEKVFNRCHIEGYLYEHDLKVRESGPTSKNPGTVYITGSVSIATDEELTNVIPVHFTYVTALTAGGKANSAFPILQKIESGALPALMTPGVDKDSAAKLAIDTSIGLNEFYSDRTGKEELVSPKRNEGGFISVVTSLKVKESDRATFDEDILIRKVKYVDADPERNTPEKLVVSGYVFDFRKSILPVDLSVTNPAAISYFMGLEASEKHPVFYHVKGVQISETIVTKTEEAGAFGEPSIRENVSSRKDWVITWGAAEPYEWDDDKTGITGVEVKEKEAAREIYLATVKQRQDEYKASRNTPAAAPVVQGYSF